MEYNCTTIRIVWSDNTKESSHSTNAIYDITCTVGKIYVQIFSFFRKSVVNITILELGLVSNERYGNFAFYRGIKEF